MQVILMERIENLGQMGDVVNVKPGFARNYLLPHRKAIRASKDNQSYFEERRAQLEADNLARRGEAEKVAEKMEGVTVVVVRAAGESGQLYGSVNARDIAEAVSAAGFTIGRQQVVIDRALKTLGLEKIRIQLHPEVSVGATVNIARSQEEAAEQQRLGRAVNRDPGMEDEIAEQEAAAFSQPDEGSLREREEEILGETPSDEAPTT
jgi:large subunit ribosomal protein L9